MKRFGGKIKEGLGEYAPETDFIQHSLLRLAARPEHLNESDLESVGEYIARGARSLVFKLGRSNAVVKLGMTSLIDDYEINLRRQRKEARRSVNALQKGTGLEHVEQLRAFRLTGIPAIVTAHESGQTLSSMSPYDLPAAPEPYMDLTRTWRAMEKRKITPDEGEQNIVWSGKNFKVIDYFSAGDPEVTSSDPKDDALHFSGMLLPEGSDILPPAALTFREVCRSQFGKEVVLDMENMWEAYNYTIPSSRQP